MFVEIGANHFVNADKVLKWRIAPDDNNWLGVYYVTAEDPETKQWVMCSEDEQEVLDFYQSIVSQLK